jgi:hypothetical protein
VNVTRLRQTPVNSGLRPPAAGFRGQQDPRVRTLLRLRKEILEHLFGIVKAVDGFRRFTVRGLEKASAQGSLVGLAVNLRKLSARAIWKAGKLVPLLRSASEASVRGGAACAGNAGTESAGGHQGKSRGAVAAGGDQVVRGTSGGGIGGGRPGREGGRREAARCF